MSPSIPSMISATVFISPGNSNTKDQFDVEASRPLIKNSDKSVQHQQKEEQEGLNSLWGVLTPILYGWNIGLLLQFLSVCANTAQMRKWHGVVPAASEDLPSFVMFHLYDFFCHIDIAVCLFIWMYLVARHSATSEFRTGIRFLIGFIVGSSVGWMTLDYMMGSPVSLLMMAATAAAKLAVCFISLRLQKASDYAETVVDEQ